MTTLERINAAAKAGHLLASSAENLAAFSTAKLPGWAAASIEELVAREAWNELNDRFYRYLEFGTGGMRGRTIGVVPAAAETGVVSPTGSPEHAAVGSNMLNDFTLVRAVVGLHRYTVKYLATRGGGAPKLVIARRRASFLPALLRAGGGNLDQARGRGLHLRRPAADPAAEFFRALAQGPRGCGDHRQSQSTPR
jgi:phosphoglucomutase